jgi:hypothetical protein
VLDLLRVDHPEVSHMLALPVLDGSDTWKNYHLLKTQVRHLIEAEGPVTDAARSRLYLKEHATALHVCDIYEQTLYQRRLAEKAGDKNRFEVLDMLAQYYETGMLRSPRFRYHWDNGASDMMEHPRVLGMTRRFGSLIPMTSQTPGPHSKADPGGKTAHFPQKLLLRSPAQPPPVLTLPDL